MWDKQTEQKLQALKKQAEHLVTHGCGDKEAVHTIRVQAREILSLLHRQGATSPELKKVISLSNKIRDIDVLLSDYLPDVPARCQRRINLSQIKDTLTTIREQEARGLLHYLSAFPEPALSPVKNADKKQAKHPPQLSRNIHKLHQYRIFIKHQLYLSRNKSGVTDPADNNLSDNNRRIHLLGRIKDTLGSIHDNYTALKLIAAISDDKKSIRPLKKYTREVNARQFRKAARLIRKLEKLQKTMPE